VASVFLLTVERLFSGYVRHVAYRRGSAVTSKAEEYRAKHVPRYMLRSVGSGRGSPLRGRTVRCVPRSSAARTGGATRYQSCEPALLFERWLGTPRDAHRWPSWPPRRRRHPRRLSLLLRPAEAGRPARSLRCRKIRALYESPTLKEDRPMLQLGGTEMGVDCFGVRFGQ
jgi:hypothetical protein